MVFCEMYGSYSISSLTRVVFSGLVNRPGLGAESSSAFPSAKSWVRIWVGSERHRSCPFELCICPWSWFRRPFAFSYIEAICGWCPIPLSSRRIHLVQGWNVIGRRLLFAWFCSIFLSNTFGFLTCDHHVWDQFRSKNPLSSVWVTSSHDTWGFWSISIQTKQESL
jgi:hypothetical protein